MKKGRPGPPRDASAPQTEASDQRSVPLDVLAAEVVEEAPPAADHLQQPAPRVVVLLVGLEVLGQLRDAPSEDGDLDLWRSRVVVGPPEVLDDLRFVVLDQWHELSARVPQGSAQPSRTTSRVRSTSSAICSMSWSGESKRTSSRRRSQSSIETSWPTRSPLKSSR